MFQGEQVQAAAGGVRLAAVRNLCWLLWWRWSCYTARRVRF